MMNKRKVTLLRPRLPVLQCRDNWLISSRLRCGGLFLPELTVVCVCVCVCVGGGALALYPLSE